MKLSRLSEQVTAAGQIAPKDVPELAAQGFRAIICNRPDGEAADQPSYREVEKAAAEKGLAFVYLPVVPSNITEADVGAFGEAVRQLPKPILAYCRSGARSTALWELSRAG